MTEESDEVNSQYSENILIEVVIKGVALVTTALERRLLIRTGADVQLHFHHSTHNPHNVNTTNVTGVAVKCDNIFTLPSLGAKPRPCPPCAAAPRRCPSPTHLAPVRGLVIASPDYVTT